MKAGVIPANFFSNGIAQLSLFDDNMPRKNSVALMDVIDQLDQSGKGKVRFADQGIEKSWATKRETFSPAYTIRYSDLLVVKQMCVVNDIVSGKGHRAYQAYATGDNASIVWKFPPLVSGACLTAGGRGAVLTRSPSTARGYG